MTIKSFIRAAFSAAGLLLLQPLGAQEKNTFCNPLDLVVPGERA